jgi:tape measure domain-containing protein
MANGGSITWILDIDDKNFSEGLSRASKKVEGFSRSVGGSLQSATDSAVHFGKILAGIGAVGATAFGALAVKGVKFAGDLESAEQGFVALLGSAKKAEAVIARVKKEAAATPFELPGLVEGTQALAAITKDGDKAVDILLDVGKAIATSGKGQAEMNSVIANLQQVASTGVVSEMDIRQFQRAIPLFNDILKASNLTTEELKGSANAADLLFGAFEKAGAKGGITAMGFTAQAGTFNQVMSNLSDTIGITLSDFVKASGIFDLFKGAVTKTTGAISGFGRKFSMIVGLIRSGIQGDLTGRFLRDFGLNEDDAIVAKWFRFGKVIRNVIESIKGIFQGQDLKAELTEAFSFFTGDNFAQAGLIADIVIGLVNAFRSLSTWIVENKETVFAFLKGVAVALAALLIIGTIAGLVSMLTNPLVLISALVGLLFVAWQKNFLGIQDITRDVVKAITEFWAKHKEDIMYIINGIKEIILWFFEQLKTFWKLYGDNIMTVARAMWEFIKSYFKNSIDILIGIIKFFVAVFKGDWQGAWDAVKSIVQASFNIIKSYFSMLGTIATEGVKAVYDTAVYWIGKAWNYVKEVAEKIRSAISNAFNVKKRNSPSILDRLSILKDAVSSTLESIQVPTYSSQISSNLGGMTDRLAYAGSTPNFTVNIGTYAGTDMEKRELARQIFEAYDDYAKGRGLTI